MANYCKICTYQNIEGALFCEECGAALNIVEDPETKRFDSKDFFSATSSIKNSPTLKFSDIYASLHVVSSGQILPLVGKTEYTIGRISSGQSVLPDIDLSPYSAYKEGVSRLHATIKFISGDATIIDLSSANGVYINGEKIKSNKDIKINHGDIISLGQFKLQILLNK
jgi:hypothetical protein